MHMRGSSGGPAIVWREYWKEASRCTIQAGPDIALEDPLGRCSQRQHPMALIDGVSRRSFQAEAIRVWLGQGFRDRIKGQQVERLHGSVLHTRNAHSTLHLYPNLLWN